MVSNSSFAALKHNTLSVGVQSFELLNAPAEAGVELQFR